MRDAARQLRVKERELVTPMPSKKRLKRNLLNVTLAGMDELELFPTHEDRQKAINEVGHAASGLANPAWWFGVVACAIVGIGAVVLSKVVIRPLLAPLGEGRWWREALDTMQIAFVLGVTFIFIRWLHRHGTAKVLRRKLLDSGIPVCVKCGYHLRGLAADTPACPECGRSLDDRARAILAGAG